MIKVISPIYVDLPRKTKKDKRIALNLNVYRNLHFQINNQVKVEYTGEMILQLYKKSFPNPIHLEFVLYKPSKRKIDRANILCIVEKFFCDALTYFKCIPDDNDDHVLSTHYTTGGVDPQNPRVEIFIKDRRDKNNE